MVWKRKILPLRYPGETGVRVGVRESKEAMSTNLNRTVHGVNEHFYEKLQNNWGQSTTAEAVCLSLGVYGCTRE